MLTNSDEIANEFNNYFVNIGRLLSKQIVISSSHKAVLLNRHGNSPCIRITYQRRISWP